MSTARAKTKLPKLRDRLALGRSGLRVSPFCQGMIDDDPSVVLAAYDAGINFFFLSADLHWPYYESLRRGLEALLARGRGIRDRIVVAAASYSTEPGFILASQRELLESVRGLERIDVIVAGGLYSVDTVRKLHALEDALADAKLGVRAIGASFHDRRAAATAHQHELFDVVFSRYNPTHPAAEHELFARLQRKTRTLLFNFKSVVGCVEDADWPKLGLSPEHWHPQPPDYYRYALTQPRVDGILGSLCTAAQVRELARGLREGPLDDEDRKYLVDLARLSERRLAPAP